MIFSRSNTGKSAVYSFDPPNATFNNVTELTFEGFISFTDIVGGDISLDGMSILLKTSMQTWMFLREDNQTVYQTLSSTNVCMLKEQDVSDVAGIAFTEDEDGYYTAGESYTPEKPTLPPSTTAPTTLESTTLGDLVSVIPPGLVTIAPFARSPIHKFEFEPLATVPPPSGAVKAKSFNAGVITMVIMSLIL